MDLTGAGPASAEFIHRVTEAMKLAFADREAYYGDPAFVDVPLERLLSEDYNAARRRLIGEQASHELSPGRLAGFEAQVDRVMDTLRRLSRSRSLARRRLPRRRRGGRVGASRRHHPR